jgi:hypothetical protein
MVDELDTPQGKIKLEKSLGIGDIIDIDGKRERLVYFEDGILYFVDETVPDWEEKLKTHLEYDRDEAVFGKFTQTYNVKYVDKKFTVMSHVGIKALNREINEANNVEVEKNNTNLKLDI